MDDIGWVQDVPSIDVVFEHAMLLVRIVEEEVMDFYNTCSNPNTVCYMWHSRTKDGVLHANSGTFL